jgi:hypothetical protein
VRNYLKEKLREDAPLEGHRLQVTFTDGFSGEVDLAALLDEGPLYEPLRDLQNFRAAKISRHGVPQWPEDFDLSPGALRAWCEAGRLLSVEETDRWIEQHPAFPEKAA